MTNTRVALNGTVAVTSKYK